MMFNEFSASVEKTPCSRSGSDEPFRYAFDDSEFWRQIPAWRDLGADRFGDYNWQQRNAVTTVPKLVDALGDAVPPSLVQDIEKGLLRTRMNMRLTPYVFSRIDWANYPEDPIRKQFIPLGSQFQPDHPENLDDSLAEENNKVTPYLVHRYPDKALFFPSPFAPSTAPSAPAAGWSAEALR